VARSRGYGQANEGESVQEEEASETMKGYGSVRGSRRRSAPNPRLQRTALRAAAEPPSRWAGAEVT